MLHKPNRNQPTLLSEYTEVDFKRRGILNINDSIKLEGWSRDIIEIRVLRNDDEANQIRISKLLLNILRLHIRMLDNQPPRPQLLHINKPLISRMLIMKRESHKMSLEPLIKINLGSQAESTSIEPGHSKAVYQDSLSTTCNSVDGRQQSLVASGEELEAPLRLKRDNTLMRDPTIYPEAPRNTEEWNWENLIPVLNSKPEWRHPILDRRLYTRIPNSLELWMDDLVEFFIHLFKHGFQVSKHPDILICIQLTPLRQTEVEVDV